jgi:hypothetical protein
MAYRKLFNNVSLESGGTSLERRRSRSFRSIETNLDTLSEVLVMRHRDILGDNPSVPPINNDSGIYFGTVDMSYSGLGGQQIPPDYNPQDYDSKTASSPWVPNTTSPEQGAQRIDSLSEDRYIINKRQSLEYGSGEGAQLTPKKSSSIISKLSLDNLQLGSSQPKIDQPTANAPQPVFNRNRG